MNPDRPEPRRCTCTAAHRPMTKYCHRCGGLVENAYESWGLLAALGFVAFVVLAALAGSR